MFLGIGASKAANAADFAWIEGEAPTHANVPVKADAFGGAMSGDAWLNVNIEDKDVEKTVPKEGVLLDYDFSAPSAGHYHFWNRLGFEVDRPPFDFQVDGGAWQSVGRDAPTFDLTELAFWTHISWLSMGEADLTAGKHTLRIRINAHGADGKPQKIHYVGDALAVVKGDWHPNGKFKPGDKGWQTDADRAAGAQVFSLKAPDGAAQTATSLAGQWQIGRWDEGLVQDRTEPIRTAPAADTLNWRAMAVPGDRNRERPDLTFAHRYFLRTRVAVPAEAAGRSFVLHLPAVNMLGSVFVNGQLCGTTKAPLAVWDCDVTKAIKPGQTNEVWVGIKDTYYGLTPDGGNNARTRFVIPTDWITSKNFISQAFDFPVWNHADNGILQTPTLVVAGRAYASDVFAIPSVKNKTLGLEVTLNNPTDAPLTVSVGNEVVPLGGGKAEKTFAPRTVTLAPNSEQVVKLSEAWANPKLWWPDDAHPQQYQVVTTLADGGKPVDERATKFGFREWDWSGTDFKLNGVNWYGRADTASFGSDAQSDLAGLKKRGINMVRLWGEGGWHELASPEAALDFFDAHGMNVRRTGIFDGEGVNYTLTPALFANWHTQLAAWAKGQRNHPSIFIWSIENEVTYINDNDGRGRGPTPQSAPFIKTGADLVAQVDPTRPQMLDGGNALGDESLPVYGIHYIEPGMGQLPDWGYNLGFPSAQIAHAQGWPITKQKPLFFGEVFYSNGYNLSTLAAAGGESAMLGKAEARPAVGLISKMLTEGMRWSGVAAFHLWGSADGAYYNSWQPIAVLQRQWDSSFGSGQKVKRTYGIFNDTHETQPLSFTWTLTLDGKKVASKTTLATLAPGSNRKFDDTLPMPTVAARQEGTLLLSLSKDGREVFRDEKPLSVLPPVRVAASAVHSQTSVTARQTSGNEFQTSAIHSRTSVVASQTSAIHSRTSVTGSRTAATGLLVFDPLGTVKAFLQSRSVPFTALAGLDSLPDAGKVLVVGKDALDAAQSTSSALAAWAASGRTVIVLEQKNPLHYQATPAQMATGSNEGRIGFPEDLDNPVFRGLRARDFQTWGPDSVLYRNAYDKPTSGGRSLLQVEDGLRSTALVEVPAGQGLMLLSQLTVGEKLGTNPVAAQLLANMIGYGASYKLVFHPVTLVASDNAPLAKAMDALGVQYEKAGDALAALNKSGSVAVMDASPANLQALAANTVKVKAFTSGGGWIVFNNLTPDGLAAYNTLVGFNHVLRPFGREKVTFPAVRSPITAGLSTSDIVMGSGKRIFDWQAGEYPAEDAFSYVVDLEDVAPFGKSPFWAYGNIVNNFTNADGWPLIINFDAPKDGKPFDIPISLPKEETIRRWTWIGNTNYFASTKVNLVFPDGTVTFNTVPNGEAQTFDINPPRRAKDITLQLAGWETRPSVTPNLGIDNISLFAQRPADFAQKVRPLLNIGALVEYPQGPGGLVLNNVLYKDTEAVPENMGKKRAILAALLRNLHAPFSGGKTIIAGANLAYTPVDLGKAANAYRGEGGWFGDRAFSFAALPTGAQTFAGVRYNIYDFKTSPVPTAVILGGGGVPGNLADHVSGIPVGQKADALFFLQAARIDSPMNDDDRKNGRRFEMARYTVHYADGQTVNIPVYSQVNVDSYKQSAPVAALPGAQVAWVAPYAGTDQSAVAYSMQWNNPRPDVEITTIDFGYGADRRGVPALLALTAAKAG